MNYPAAELRGIKMNLYIINPDAEHRGILLIKKIKILTGREALPKGRTLALKGGELYFLRDHQKIIVTLKQKCTEQCASMHRKMYIGIWCNIISHINQYVIIGTIFAICYT